MCAILCQKIVQDGPKLFKHSDTECVDASSYCEFFTEIVGQPVI